MPVPGDTLTRRFSLFDAAGNPITGATFTIEGRDPTGASFFPAPPIDLGNGIHEVRHTTTETDATGQYYVLARAETVPPQVIEVEWLVSPPGIAERWTAGDTLVERIPVVDHLGDPVTGATFTTHGVTPAGSSFLVPPPIERGNGVYEVMVRTSPLDRPGSTYVQLRTDTTDPPQVFEVEWVTGRSAPVVGTTLRQLRRMVMARFGDLVTVRATANWSEMTMIDQDNAYGEPGRFAGREALFLNGGNAGQVRYIKGSSRDESILNFHRALPFSTMAGDEADLTNAYGMGVTFRAVRDAINYAMAVSRQYHLVPVTYETPTPYRAAHDAMSVPMDMVGVEAVEGVDARGRARSISRASSRGGNGWSLDHASHSVVLRGNEARQADGWTLRVSGYALPHDLEHDDDTTTVDIEWLIDMATSHLCLDTLLSRQATGDWGSKGMLYKQNAERLLSRLTPVLGSSFVRFQ